jgi:hypothetical protein
MGRKHTTDHRNRDCREAVTLALYLARRWGSDQYVLFGHSSMRYVVHPCLSASAAQTGYRVTPSGEVIASRGYPARATLFAPMKEG